GLAQAWINLGNTDARVARWDEAARSYRRALAIAPGRADALSNLAFALLHSRRPGALPEAERLARRAVARGGSRDSMYRARLGDRRLPARVRRLAQGAALEAVVGDMHHALLAVLRVVPEGAVRPGLDPADLEEAFADHRAEVNPGGPVSICPRTVEGDTLPT